METISKKRNILLICLCFFAYTSSYFLKLSYNANVAEIEDFFSVSHSQTGLVSTLFLICYGAGQIINGIFAKKYPLRYVIPGALFVSAVINLLIFLTPSDSFHLIKYYWLINGIVLSFMWPCTVRAIAENADDAFKDKAILAIGATTAVGTFATYGLSALFSYICYFKAIFIFAVSVGAAFALLWFFLYPKAELKKDTVTETDISEKHQRDRLSSLLIVFAVIMCLCTLVSTLSRDGLMLWFPIMLKEDYGFENAASILATTLLPLSQILGTYLSIKIANWLKNYTVSCALLFSASAVMLLLSNYIQLSNAWLLITTSVISSLMMAGVINVATSMIPVKFFKENSGLFAGIFNGCGYAGSAVSSYVLGTVGEHYGWNPVILSIALSCAGCAVIGFVFFAVLKLRNKKSTD